jgi:antitoxin component of RelBE/YafQ-DinJ toxin-antitoxin module
MSPSSVIQMLYSQIVLQKGLPFEVKLPSREPTAIGGMTQAELDQELTKGIQSLRMGKGYSVDEADAVLTKEFNV